MPKYTTTVKSPWTAQRAFEYLSDLSHFVDWDPGVTRAVQVIGMGPGPDAAFDVTVKSVSSNMTLRYKTVVFEPNRRIEVLAESTSLRSYDVMTFEEIVGGGCEVTYSAELDLRGVRAVANPLLSLLFKGIGDRAAQGLRRVLNDPETHL